jgi:NAD(P)-dependent dehydrogenase (short-subunit alcohol dehydrogenase family)
VLASGDVRIKYAPTEAITLDNPMDRHFYERLLSYGQAKSANAIYAKELSRRLASRGVSVNSWDAGSIRDAGLNRHQGRTRRLIYRLPTVHEVRRPARGDCSASGGMSRDRRHIGRALVEVPDHPWQPASG